MIVRNPPIACHDRDDQFVTTLASIRLMMLSPEMKAVPRQRAISIPIPSPDCQSDPMILHPSLAGLFILCPCVQGFPSGHNRSRAIDKLSRASKPATQEGPVSLSPIKPQASLRRLGTATRVLYAHPVDSRRDWPVVNVRSSPKGLSYLQSVRPRGRRAAVLPLTRPPFVVEATVYNCLLRHRKLSFTGRSLFTVAGLANATRLQKGVGEGFQPIGSPR
ncbi:hypothetical protein BP00DRAFT_31780 [Aspergillus indologenus CBS 114.80]|uniref:Uncharacterized protein n=1 Tax=Aspergillus indologenus CBS 114.80 TaxID=1450541 RepID=A0A2V5HS34_9EURO|nr:hypothetical protein BP00DRAFT_31780 [Aspergillus indologenus CBS 114.80]